MKRLTIFFFLFFSVIPLQANELDAGKYFNLGLTSSMTVKKIEYFSKALELNPELAEAYEKRGLLYFFQEKYDRMIQDFQKHIEFAPEKAESYRMLGLGLLKSHIYDEAIESFTRAIEIEPENASAYANRAEAYLSSGNYEEAIRDSTRAIKIWGDPRTMSDAYKTRARVYWDIGRNEEAYADNRRAMKMDPRVPRLWGGYPPLESMRGMGLILLIGILFVLIFGLKLKPPEKDK